MHVLQPKHFKLKPDELKKLLDNYRITVPQLPKIKITDTSLPEGCQRGDVIKIERKLDNETVAYYRVEI